MAASSREGVAVHRDAVTSAPSRVAAVTWHAGARALELMAGLTLLLAWVAS